MAAKRRNNTGPADFDAIERHLASTGWYGGSATREAHRQTQKPITLSVTRERLNSGGYARTGEYFGRGAPLFAWGDDSSTFGGHLRAADRSDAKAILLAVARGEMKVNDTSLNELRGVPIKFKR